MTNDTSLLQLLKAEDYAVNQLFHCCTPSEETKRQKSLEDSQKYCEEQIISLKDSIQRRENKIQERENLKERSASSQEILDILNSGILSDQQAIIQYQEEILRYEDQIKHLQYLMSVSLQEEWQQNLEDARTQIRDYLKTYINKED